MLPILRRWAFYAVFTSISLFLLLRFIYATAQADGGPAISRLRWQDVPVHYPVANMTALPSGPCVGIPKLQTHYVFRSAKERVVQQERLAAVKEAFVHSWHGYKRNAWSQDEVAPVSGRIHNNFGGWGATLIDSLDSLWILGLKEEFADALTQLHKVDFGTTAADELNVFETTIRYLGGLIAAYDVSEHRYHILLDKAVQVGEMLYKAFDTPNHMPITRWNWRSGAQGGAQEAASFSLLAEVGSFSLEFTRLSQLTGDSKWYDIVARITDAFEAQQNHTKIPGLFPSQLDTQHMDFTRDITFTFGGQADSVYEYFSKQHLLLGGRNEQYRTLYSTALASAKQHLFFRPLNPNNLDLLLSGTLKRFSAGRITLVTEAEHLSCFAGGMVALAAKAFREEQNIETARQLVGGCLWAYESMPSGIMPEVIRVAPCQVTEDDDCTWSEERWFDAVAADSTAQSPQQTINDKGLAPGFLDVPDPRYLLRPEAIESLFVLYRITGDEALRDKAWVMFQAISNATRTDIAYASIEDVRASKWSDVRWIDSMESFWLGETLKYFYLMFSDPDVISLDEYVLTTEAHPLLRPA
ncbi:glycoside hydrolase family 47 protein [Baudoinia panamericana UAMH 10762]|uniref:alpha-1,2-Mannosidase n=1 Tax=Baudoinia panamericana (strain UAMH 10762) TaxID=717646 RepID=M2LW59_BAUPA|nr:glycoside hydrolase family 47 protein [Baudoinia panamericana UAMH 10762]EMC98902.1 glycoside hydrolase family 47 protein [Baudoinia panamericana UAMH 10762]